jgi:hypothetical protein
MSCFKAVLSLSPLLITMNDYCQITQILLKKAVIDTKRSFGNCAQKRVSCSEVYSIRNNASSRRSIALLITQPKNTYSHSPSTPQRVFVLSAKRYPSPDRMGGLCSGFPTAQGKQQCTYRLGGVSVQQSADTLAIVPQI